MRVRMVAACVDEVREYQIGDVVELPDVKAERFVKVGLAESYTEEPKGKARSAPETAAVEPAAETATLPTGKKRPV